MILRFTAVLLLLLVLGTLVILVHPVLFTGRYYEMTIRSVEIGADGRVYINYEDTLTYGTSVTWRYPLPRGAGGIEDYWDRRRGGFLRWPRQEREKVFAFNLTTETERESGRWTVPEVQQRLLLKEGTYRVRPGERLVCYRVPGPGDTPLESTIEVQTRP